ncbi:MAG: hypothetical protein JW996_03460 [Candidatus Cloacimonetes bacterium]|nr:hypothetical protein [Candidatus Cloacimonadota bacterium]
MKKISTGSLLLFLVFIITAVSTVEQRPYRLLNSDLLTIRETNEEYITNLVGNVHFFYGETEFYCDRAEIYEKQKITRMQGNVHVLEDTLKLWADQVEYFRLQEVLQLDGNIKIEESHQDSTKRYFEAEHVEYFRNERQLNAFENVIFLDERENLNGLCGELRYSLETGYGFLLKEPVIWMTDKDSMAVQAEKMEYYKDFKKIIANFNVMVSSSEFELKSDFLLYFAEEERAIFLGNPKFNSDFADAVSEELEIHFNERKIEKANLQDSCLVFFRVEGSDEKKSWVKAERMEFDFIKGKIDFGRATSNVHSYFEQDKTVKRDYSVNESTGSELHLYIKDEKIEAIKMFDQVGGMYKFHKK